MKIKITLIFGLLVGLIAATAGAVESPKPNIVYFLVDDMGFADAGFSGSKEIKTPNIDKLAASGAVLTDFYAQLVCSPTRACIMTGRLPTHTGAYGLFGPGVKVGFSLKERLLPQALHEAGYTSAISGKWHLGHFPEYAPTHRGFDFQYGCWDGGLNYFTHIAVKKLDWYRQDELCEEEGYTTHLITKEVKRVIELQPESKPLFLYVAFNAVHSPFQVPDSYEEPYANLSKNRKTMAGLIASVDEAIGQVVDALKKKGILENTLIIFSSDNGGVYPRQYTDNGPLRDGKDTIYEGGVRVPAFVTWPGRIPAGITIKEPMHVIDWYPTLVKLVGLPLTQELPLDGRDIWPVLTQGAKSPHDALLLVGREPGMAAIRMGDWKLLVNPEDKYLDKKRSYTPGAKNANGERVELYNLAKDISETKNLAISNPEKVKELRKRLDEFLKNAEKPAGNKDGGTKEKGKKSNAEE